MFVVCRLLFVVCCLLLMILLLLLYQGNQTSDAEGGWEGLLEKLVD